MTEPTDQYEPSSRAWSFASERSTTRAENHRLRPATGWADNSGLDFLDTFLSRQKYH